MGPLLNQALATTKPRTSISHAHGGAPSADGFKRKRVVLLEFIPCKIQPRSDEGIRAIIRNSCEHFLSTPFEGGDLHSFCEQARHSNDLLHEGDTTMEIV